MIQFGRLRIMLTYGIGAQPGRSMYSGWFEYCFLHLGILF